MDLLNPHLTQEEIAERNGYKDRREIIRLKKTICDKIANVAEMSHEDLQSADTIIKRLHQRPQDNI